MTLAAGALAAAFALSALAVVAMLAAPARLPHAVPNARGLHDRPVPRVGGLALWAGALPVAIALPPDVRGHPLAWLAAFAVVAAVSLADAARGVGVLPRLAAQLGAAAALAWSIASGANGLHAGGFVLVVLAIGWSANLYNFMDGSDGLAAAMAIVGFAAFAAALAHAGRPWIAVAAIAVATLPLFAVNRPPARLFLGDVAAVPLGLLAAAFGADGVASGAWPAWFPLLVFLPFVADASVTLAARLARGERVWEAHRSHHYQRLNALGAGHGGTLAAFGALIVLCAAAALGCLVAAPGAGWPALGIFCAIHAVVFTTIHYHWRKQQLRLR